MVSGALLNTFLIGLSVLSLVIPEHHLAAISFFPWSRMSTSAPLIGQWSLAAFLRCGSSTMIAVIFAFAVTGSWCGVYRLVRFRADDRMEGVGVALVMGAAIIGAALLGAGLVGLFRAP